uniref:Uncharacterized protein n=1 Tax=Lotharella globosa TaxID=91324 RepID=A0A7S3Z812_9EUKA|mmetsp:Transcript_4768/g.9279  ORF Transcript_4768/g.9279 Transcript_4768/m.9279 type:complete len:136 (+) Transcript_4768:34-441(+)
MGCGPISQAAGETDMSLLDLAIHDERMRRTPPPIGSNIGSLSSSHGPSSRTDGDPSQNIVLSQHDQSHAMLSQKLLERRRFHPMGGDYCDNDELEFPEGILSTRRVFISPGKRSARARELASQLRRSLDEIQRES